MKPRNSNETTSTNETVAAHCFLPNKVRSRSCPNGHFQPPSKCKRNDPKRLFVLLDYFFFVAGFFFFLGGSSSAKRSSSGKSSPSGKSHPSGMGAGRSAAECASRNGSALWPLAFALAFGLWPFCFDAALAFTAALVDDEARLSTPPASSGMGSGRSAAGAAPLRRLDAALMGAGRRRFAPAGRVGCCSRKESPEAFLFRPCVHACMEFRQEPRSTMPGWKNVFCSTPGLKTQTRAAAEKRRQDQIESSPSPIRARRGLENCTGGRKR